MLLNTCSPGCQTEHSVSRLCGHFCRNSICCEAIKSSCSIFLFRTLHTTNMPPSRTQRPRNGPGADPKRYICGLCGQGLSRRYAVYNSHFQRSVKRNGNPNKLPWDSHPSCQPQGLGPEGTSPPSKTYKVSRFILRGPDGHELICVQEFLSIVSRNEQGTDSTLTTTPDKRFQESSAADGARHTEEKDVEYSAKGTGPQSRPVPPPKLDVGISHVARQSFDHHSHQHRPPAHLTAL